MDFEKLINNCQTLEKTIAILIKSNSSKRAEIASLQNAIVERSRDSLAELLDSERKYQDQLDTLKWKKNEVETEVRQYTEINDKLSNIVMVAQKSSSDAQELNECQNEEINFENSEIYREYENIKLEYSKMISKINEMNYNLENDSNTIHGLIRKNQELVVNIKRNDTVTRISQQQGMYAEKQFDLILNQIPWEPLTEQYLGELKQSSKQAVRDISETLRMQKTEIEDLNESLRFKMRKKLQVLEALDKELNKFAQKRDEAALVSRFIDIS